MLLHTNVYQFETIKYKKDIHIILQSLLSQKSDLLIMLVTFDNRQIWIKLLNISSDVVYTYTKLEQVTPFCELK